MEAEIERILEALLAGETVDPVDPDTLQLVESALVEDYLEGTLTQAEAELFTLNYLITDERRELLDEVRLLKGASSDRLVFDVTEIVPAAEEEGQSSSPKLGSILLVVIVLFLVASIAWRLLST